MHATFEQLRQTAPGSRLIFTYVRQDFIDGVNLYGAQTLLPKNPEAPASCGSRASSPKRLEEILRGYGWRLIEQAGPGYYRDTYIRPTGRKISASQIEWTAHAVRA